MSTNYSRSFLESTLLESFPGAISSTIHKMANVNCVFGKPFKNKNLFVSSDFSVSLDIESTTEPGQIRIHFPRSVLTALCKSIMNESARHICEVILTNCLKEIGSTIYNSAKTDVLLNGVHLGPPLPINFAQKNDQKIDIPIAPTVLPFNLLGGVCYAEFIFLQRNMSGIISSDIERMSKLELEKTRAEMSNKAKGTFITNVSKEIKCKLDLIAGHSEELSKKAAVLPEIDKISESLKRSTDHLTMIINNVLTLSKIESSDIEIEKASVDIAEVLTDVVDLLKEDANTKGIDLVFSVENNKMTIITDPAILRQILFNVISNAIRYTHQGSVSVVLSPDVDRNCFMITVKDTGCGVSKEVAEKLFQHLSDDNTIEKLSVNSGIGLSISRHLARLLGGDVVLNESILNSGSSFAVTVRDWDGVGTSEVGRNNTAELHPKPNLSIKDLRILMVDDSEDMLDLISFYLRGAGAVVDCATSGKMAIEKVKQEKYDIAIIDISMPIQDGYSAKAEIRSICENLPMIALTANDRASDIRRSLQSGFIAHVVRPITIEDLIARIISSLEAHRVKQN